MFKQLYSSIFGITVFSVILQCIFHSFILLCLELQVLFHRFVSFVLQSRNKRCTKHHFSAFGITSVFVYFSVNAIFQIIQLH